MAKAKQGKQARSKFISEDYWQQSWVKRVMQGEYTEFAKLLFVRLTSFEATGCGLTNAELVAELNTSKSSIRRSLTSLSDGGELLITARESRRRRIYAARHPEVEEKIKDLGLDGK